MPVKWTPENDQILLLKILETSNVNADAKAIAAAWPKNDASGAVKGSKDMPTARAITERLVTIRAKAKVNGAGHFSVSSSQSKSGGLRTPNTTPRKPKAANCNSSATKGNGATKRKRGENKVTEEEDLSASEDCDETVEQVEKRVKREVTGVKKYKESEDEGKYGAGSSVSEFEADAEVKEEAAGEGEEVFA